ncbi:MAG: acetyl-CoA carboxylase biotin carboxylase subunit, partial [candidate division Zixibacteria bacterium]|nr:acetyl-CoA carboxylase biotin carboxylase subunit [candidate division Zixibacteria bacterium]NIR66488.1 acetyl-CoA carboxylase biotin carboxylase subunit [candidate division Zixibacteria bacterium]NIS16296.1 acetyl-CoA carboxylase biotin carboxylase subunit [candidate division Zixibacteria bacterium]NIS47432.1 acetyl-CoA carboxylase biotin carboxylase subunit [candidate division Zixibacteria bacterium]NIT52669.1 acetyl-CoA carboxylase biotin carboxylase subunit [candidate division Zixibacter
FKKILIANRGEIALRIIRACKEMGIKTVAVYSEADLDSLHVRFADEEVCIGPPPSNQSYLDVKRIISAAEVTNCDAIHPGYGFLAENADFAEICESCGLIFIGPSPESMRKMGDKATAKRLMREAGVPVVPGSEGIVPTLPEAESICAEIGYPVIIKASAGGGGRGMRVVTRKEELKTAFNTARMEAGAAFSNPEVYIEKFVTQPRHIEIQILADKHGNTVHLGERDCTIQRRHQKLIEESPSPALDEETRKNMGEAAINGAIAAGYYNAGTIEFLYDEDGSFYFMEMNTRIQVEHPVTEEVTDVDLIRNQLLIAAGEKMEVRQEDIKFKGHAIECRINAEDPMNNFRPAPGQITSFHTPGGHGIRVDTHAYAKYVIPPFYDSMIAKLITHARDRDYAIMKMKRALEEFIIEGIPTTIPFHRSVIDDPVFQSGVYSTKYIDGFKWKEKEEAAVK